MDGKQIGLKLRNGLSVVFLIALGGVGMNNLYDHLTKDDDNPPAPPPATQPTAAPVQPPPTVISIPAPANDGIALAPGAYAARRITAGEVQLAAKLFGTALDVSQLKFQFFREPADNRVSGIPPGSTDTINIYGKDIAARDYSREGAENFGTFVHELTHVWQNQTNDRFTSSYVPEGNKYLYPLEAKYKFTDYGTEQQAAMVEDYARRFLHPSKSFTWLGQVYDDPESKAAMLMKTVETQFPAAKQLRLNYERSRTYGGTPVASFRPAAIPAYG